MVVLPTACAVAMPALLMVAIEGALSVQVTEPLRSLLLPSLYFPIAVNCCLLVSGNRDIGRGNGQRHQLRAVVDLPDLRSGKGSVVDAEVIHRTGVKFVRASTRK